MSLEPPSAVRSSDRTGPPPQEGAFHYCAFISYSHKDERRAAWLHRQIESYSGHAKLAGSTNLRGETVPKRLFPVFRDRDELAGAPDLTERIQEALRESRFLVVVCSPHAAASRWVNEEIKAFKALGGETRVLAFIADGEPNAGDDPATQAQECFPEALRYRIGDAGALTSERTEPIAADGRKGKDGDHNALLKIIAGILGIRFDDLRRRDQERAARRRNWITVGSLSAAAVFAGIAGYAYQQKLLAEGRARVALSRQLAAQALNELPSAAVGGGRSDHALALLLAVRALETEPTIEARSVLLKAVLASPHRLKFLWQHTAPVTGLAFSGDGQRFASASGEDTVMLWDAATQRPIGGPIAVAGVGSLAFSPAGKLLALGGEQTGLRLWDLASRRLIGEPLAGTDHAVRSLAFSPDASLLAAGGGGEMRGAGELLVWRIADGTPRLLPIADQGVTPHHKPIAALVFNPDGKTLASASGDGVLVTWDLARMNPPRVQEGHLFTSLAFSADGRSLASGGASGTGTRRIVKQPFGLMLWDSVNGTSHAVAPPQVVDDVKSVAVAADSGVVASGGQDGALLLWDVKSNDPEAKPLLGHRAAVTRLAFSPDGSVLVSGSADGTLLWRDLRSSGPLALVIDDAASRKAAGSNPFYHVGGLALSPDGQTLAAQRAGAIGLWDAASGALRRSLPAEGSWEASLTFSPDGKVLASAGQDGVHLWNVASAESLGMPVEHETVIDSRSFSPDGRTLAVKRPDGSILLWDIAARAAVGKLLVAGRTELSDLAFAPNGKTLASGSKEGVVTLWDVAGRKPLREPLAGHDGWVEGLAFSPDGKLLALVASRAQASTLTLWHLERGERTDLSSVRRIRSARLAFSPDSKLLVAEADDGTVLLWDPANPKAQVAELGGHGKRLVAFAFSPPSDILVSVDEGGTAILWDLARRVSVGRIDAGHAQGVRNAAFDRSAHSLLSSGQWGPELIVTDLNPLSWARYACQAANRDLTRAEWQRIVGAELAYEPTCPPLPGRGR